jgi:hypothetical protein
MNIFDPHISGSLSVSGSGEISGDLTVLGTLFATISGTSQNAISASHAAKYLLTSSFETFTGSYTTGAFTGSFIGDGSGLYNIPASGVTGLNLTRIADGSATASISSANGLRINTNTEITGTLKVNNFNLGGDDIVEITLTDAGGKYYVNGIKNPKLSFIRGFKYRFYFDNNNVHPLLFSLTNDGEHNGGVVYTTGVTTGATPFYVQIDVTDVTPSTLYYFCDFHVGMGNSITVYSDFLNAQSSVNLTTVDTGMFATTGSNNFTNIQRTSGSLVVTGSVDVTGSINLFGVANISGSISLNGQAIGTGKLDETVFNTYTSSNDGRLFAIENSTSSYNTFTSSIDTRIKNEMNEENVISGSIQVILTGTTGYSTFSSSVSSSIGALSSSVATTTSGLSSSIGSLSSSVEGVTSGLSSSITSLSSSVATTTSGLSSSIGSLSSSISSTNDTQNGRLTSIETSTGSLNTFTSSINTTIKNKLNTESVISGSIQVVITGTTGYSTFSSSISTSVASLSSSISTSIDSLSSSVATTTSGLSSSIGTISSSFSSTNNTQNGRLNSIETSTGSLNTFTSSIDTTIKNKLNTESVISGSSQILITGTTGYSTFSSSVSSSIGALSSSVSTTTSGLSSSIGSVSSSLSTTNDTQNGRLTSIETSTGSLNSFTSSIDTTIKNKINTESVISGSVQILITGTTGYSTFSSSVSTSIGSLSSSIATTTNGLSSSIATTTNGLSSSIATTTSGLTLSISSLSSSVATTTSGLSSSIGGLSSSIATTNLNQNNRLDFIEGKTGSYATTGSNVFKGDQTITGSLYISQNLIVQGSSSLENITASAVSIGTNTIVLNTDSPAFRYAGISVFDSGSTNITSSLFYDSLTNQWKFKHMDTGTNDASIMLFGPLGNDIDNAPLLDGNYLTKVENNGHGHHLTTSSIFDNGSKVSINSNTEVTGTLKVTGNISSPNITAIETSTGSLNTFTSSLLTAIELTGSNLTVRGNLLVKGTTTNVNTTTLDVDNNLINLNGTGATSAGLRVKDTTGPNQVSGSLLWDATNDYWIGGPLGSEQRLVRETEFNTQVTRINNVETSTASLNSFTSSINTTIKNRLNTEGVISGSVQVNHNATTNYDANQHVDHTAVSVSAGSGLSGGGTIASTRTLTLDTGSVHFLDGVKKELNTEGVISGSSQVLSGTGIWSGSAQLPSGVVSSSAQVISSLPSGTVSGSSQVLSGTGIWSGSAQLPSGVVSGSSQVLAGTTIHSGAFFNGISVVSGSAQISFNGITDKPALVSGSSQIAFLSISNIPSGLVSGSSQVLSGTGIWSGSAQLPSGVISGSAQVISLLPSGTISGSAQLTSTFVQKAGDTMTGQLIIGSTGTAGAATLKINTSSAISFIHSQENFSANMTAGQTNILVVGQAGSTKNAGYLGYNWSSSASNSNFISLGHWGSDNLLRVYGDGTVYMGTVTTGVWNGTAISDTYISSASNWNTAYNKRISSLGFTSSTVTITLADTSTVTASVPTFNQNTTGNAGSATILQTTRTIGGVSFNGSANIDLPGVNTGGNQNTTGNASTATEVIRTVSADNEANLLYATIGTNDFFRIRVGGGSNAGFAEIATADDATEPIYVRQYSGTFSTLTRTATLLDGSGNTSFPGTVTAPTFSGVASSISNQANSATITASTTIDANNIVRRDGNGYIYANHVNFNTSETENPTISSFITSNGDGWSRKSSLAHVRSQLGNYGGWITGISFANVSSKPTTISGYGITDAITTGNISSQSVNYASTAGSADQIDGIGIRNTNTSGVAANTLDSNGFTYVTDVDGSSSNLTGNSTDGALYSQIYSSSWQHQIYGDYRTGIMYVRGKNSGTWQSWKRVALSSATTFSSVTSLTFTHNLGTANLTAQVFDTNGDMFFPSNIRISSTQVIVTFASSRSGRLVVTG